MAANDKQVIELNIPTNGSCAVMKDPYREGIEHIETLLPFTEIAKLKRGNANVRSVAERKPFKGMVDTVEKFPADFHLKNRGIIYLCSDAEYDAKSKKLRITVPKSSDRKRNEPFGAMDGGHSLAVITKTVKEMDEGAFNNITDWSSPFARVRFTVNRTALPVAEIAEAVNTSLQVTQYTIDAFQGKFDWFKRVLRDQGFDDGLVSFVQGEDKAWHVLEMAQRVCMFLPDKWESTPPLAMYKSTIKALQTFTDPKNEKALRSLAPVMVDILTLPEFIQHQFSMGDVLKNKKLGKLQGVHKLGLERPEPIKDGVKAPARQKTYTRPGTEWSTEHRIEMGILLPMAAAFRGALYMKRGTTEYAWKVQPKVILDACATKLYEAAAKRLAETRAVAPVASDPSYWTTCENIVMRTMASIIEGEAE
jgi:hypothetical protein